VRRAVSVVRILEWSLALRTSHPRIVFVLS
jgi:hypothetical protein